MTVKCLDFNGVPLVSHAGSTTYFLARVVSPLGGLQTVPKGTTRTEFEHTWREDLTSIDRLSEIERVMTAWQTTVIEHLYFPEHPTQDEQDFQATEEYILRFYRWGPSENDDFTDSPPVESRLTATFTLPPRQGEPWLEDRCTFLGKASFSLTPRNQALSRDRTHLFAQLSTSISTTECIFPRRASVPPPYPCTLA
ncbi:hypothetical protein CRG98_021170 [Punica granatum]|uniref:Uncharacterized protein n=1 Tax=Punica granatum TaxID=22663 RepID=A0A2I0JQ46_PUNGR|nr:hypothetical protein CRG98_021170 [Punica granatum]